MEIHFLGTGSAYPGAKRDNTSLCMSNNGYQVLVDVSGNPNMKLKQIGVQLGELDTVIFTHFHIDHIYGLPSLLWGMWLENRKKSLTIYCHQQNKAKLNEWLDTMEVAQWGIEFPIEIKTFNGDYIQNLLFEGNMRISCFPALHSVPTVGLEIQNDEKLVIYSGDTEPNSHIQSYKYIDVLIHEATSARKIADNHTSMLEIVKEYDLSKIHEVIMVHLSDGEPYEEELSLLEIAENKIKVAEDMMCIKL